MVINKWPFNSLAPHGSMMVPEQPFLGPLYSPAEVLDPSAFMGLDSTAEFLQDRAGKKQLLCCDCLSLAGSKGGRLENCGLLVVESLGGGLDTYNESR